MKYIIFDFDGTIGDSQSLIVKTLQDTMRARKLEVKSEEACAKTIGLRLDEAFVSLFGMSAEEGLACAATYREIFLDNKKTMIVQPFPHVIETLRALHRQGYILGMASSRNHCSLDGYVHQMQLEDIFSSIVAGDDVEHVKPAPDMVFKALGEMKGMNNPGTSAEDIKDVLAETLVVGDMNFDVDMAHHAGCKACAVTYGNGTREQLASAEFIIDDFAELLELV
ncbi:HAD family hydrolase [Segatella copri]|uniref:HAD family hydrolase n=1 Tax=Segatella copri TaxID=165179 RepID=UPI0025CEC12E|nr:HAD family hydrolase [Segatella copri]MDV3107450.1 HAD family hydrolase [Segatella copri]WOF87011.1 HAD family hydrolase [Segatella copri]WOF93242.1 HAD family hydrolase [Segatella copri]